MRRMMTRAGLAALLLGLSALLPAAPVTVEQTLANGLKVVVREDRRAPLVVVQLWYRVGSSYEPDGQTGISHALEHMMFKGTPRVPGDEFSRIVSLFGGQDNAFTAGDYTTYYQIYTADKLALALELEADRMRNLVLRPEDFAQEMRVVMEERRQRTDDNPQARAFERFQVLARLTSPARQPTVGWMRDLEAMTLADLQAWYDRWYAPNNATLVVAGDVEAPAVMALAERFFGGIAARPLPAVRLPRELDEPGDRRLTLRLPGKVPALYLGYNVPSRQTAGPGEAEALRLLVGVLDEGYSARLETRLVREQGVAAAVNSGYDPFARGDALFVVTAVPAPGRSLDELEAALLAEIEALKTEPVTQAELDRVYAGLLAADVFSRDSVREQATVIGRLESVGLSWRLADEWPQQLRAVPPEQVQAAARRWLVPGRRTLLRLEPEALVQEVRR